MPTEEEIFEYLVELRDEGVTNMYGASPYIADEFGLNSKESKEWLSKWMNSFN